MATKLKQRVVSQRAVMARVNRLLESENKVLRAARSAAEVKELGDFFVCEDGGVVPVDLEKYARQITALKNYESLGEE